MSNNLYFEAIKEAEQIKYAAEEKVKQQIIESISPRIKLLIEQKMSDDKEDSDESDKPENSDENTNEDQEASEQEECGTTESVHEVVLDEESRSILRKFVNGQAQKNALVEKIEELREAVKTIKKAIILSENAKNSGKSKQKISMLYKNIVQEAKNINRSSIIKSDNEILQEYYKLLKELHNMSKRRKNRIDETLEELLEMNLFEEDGDDDEESDKSKPEGDDDDFLASMMDDSDEDSDDDSDDDMPEPSSSQSVSKDTTVEDLAMMAGLLEDSDSDDDDDSDELELESLFEDDESYEESLHAGTEEEGENCGPDEMAESFGRRDRVLEIDENMLRREIGKMKAIREGEAKDMAHHFGGGSLEGEAFVDGVELNKLHEMKIKAAKVVRMNRMLESKLSQYKKALRGMKGQLTEMNLFNAKLLYANKLMQNRDLSIKQQRHVVESLDEAKTMGEAKILFESLSKSLVSSRPARRSGNLSEGTIRRRTGSASASVKSAQPLKESVALDRWATLAGIK